MRSFYSAIEHDPEFAAAYGAAATCLAWRKTNGWVSDLSRETGEAERLARRAMELGSHDAVALCWAAWALTFAAGHLEAGAELISRVLKLNPNMRMAWHINGWIKNWVGEPDAAIRHFKQSERLSPLDPLLFNTHLGVACAHFLAGRHQEASSWAASILRERTGYYAATRIAAASLACLGRLEEAQQMVAHLLEADPLLRLSNLVDRLGPYRSDPLSKLREGLRLAGLPE